MVVVLCFFLFPLFISGPQDQDLMGQEQEGCNGNWWTIMAQIVNFVPTEKRVLQAFLWILALCLNVFLVFVPYAWNRCETDDLKQLYASFYGGSYRYLWGLSWCWIAYACATGRGGILSRFLAWNPFVVLGRLTFGVYLIQYVVFIARQGVSTNTLQVNEFLQVKDSLGVAVISYFFAYLLYVVYEAPVSGITRMIFQFHKIRKSGGGSKKRPQQPQPESPPPTATTSEPTSNGSAATPMAINDSNHTTTTIPEEP
ncbi:hypothetical protein MTO96_006205 [Rhipicephalus appendiculatus]